MKLQKEATYCQVTGDPTWGHKSDINALLRILRNWETLHVQTDSIQNPQQGF